MRRFIPWLLLVLPGMGQTNSHDLVHGVTVSCQGVGRVWGTDGFATELDRLVALGVNWVAIHPYARIHDDGRVTHGLDPEQPPTWLTRPIEEAHARGMSILIKPHLAYWGSPFSWRGEIEFAEPEQRTRFFEQYASWITDLARVTADADSFCVGTELDRLVSHEKPWRELIAAVRSITEAHLTYAANWSDVERVPFWDALDAVGVQAYFPLLEVGDEEPTAGRLLAGWTPHLKRLRQLHERTGKPVVFTELGYDRALSAAAEPWAGGSRRTEPTQAATELQERCYTVALEVLDRESSWLRGAFLWKWFVGEARWADFPLDTDGMRALLTGSWATGESAEK